MSSGSAAGQDVARKRPEALLLKNGAWPAINVSTNCFFSRGPPKSHLGLVETAVVAEVCILLRSAIYIFTSRNQIGLPHTKFGVFS